MWNNMYGLCDHGMKSSIRKQEGSLGHVKPDMVPGALCVLSEYQMDKPVRCICASLSSAHRNSNELIKIKKHFSVH